MQNHPANARRPRTAAGSIPPNITLTFAQVIAVANSIRKNTVCCDKLTVNTITTTLSDAFRNSAETDHKTIATEALARLVVTHGCSRTQDPTQTLNTIWDEATAKENISVAIDAAVAEGYDGELICWDIISVESINHVGLIRKEASKLLRKLPERSTEELIGYGWTGLRFALRQYNPDLGFSFSTYACPRINGAIRDGVRSESPLPKRLTTVVRAAVAAEEKLTHELQRTPTYKEIAEELDSIKTAALLPRLQPTASIEELSTVWNSDKYRDPDFLIDDVDPADETHRLIQVQAVRAAIDELPKDEAAAIQLLCLEERTLSDAADALGVESRVLRAAKRRGLTALANKLEALKTSI